MASYQFGDACYSTALSAAQAAAASQIGAVVQIGTASYVVDVVTVSPSSITYKFQNVSSTAILIKSASFTPLSCGLLDTSDGLIVGWAIAAAWLVTAAVLHLRRGVQA